VVASAGVIERSFFGANGVRLPGLRAAISLHPASGHPKALPAGAKEVWFLAEHLVNVPLTQAE
jgi:hypothetical protein